MKKCIIITSYIDGTVSSSIDINDDDFVICADGGYIHAQHEGITPQIIIGDFDSCQIPTEISQKISTIKMPSEKDDTDTLLCLKYAIENGFKEITIVGGMGGRLDHTLSNIQTLSFGLEEGVRVSMRDEKNIVYMLLGCNTLPSMTAPGAKSYVPSSLTLDTVIGYKVSLLAYSDDCMGVTATGLKYPLENTTLTCSFPIGVSNEFVNGESAVISVKSGKLLVIMSRD